MLTKIDVIAASSLQHDIFEHNQEPAPGIENQQNHQADHQKASAEENYSEADWAAYYQYYGEILDAASYV